MKRHYKFYLFTACAIALSSPVSANKPIKPTLELKLDITSNWKVIKNSNGIVASIKQGLLNGEKVFYVKFENKNSTETSFSWQLITANGEALNVSQSIVIPSNETVEASTNNDAMIIVVSKETSFQNTSIKVTLK